MARFEVDVPEDSMAARSESAFVAEVAICCCDLKKIYDGKIEAVAGVSLQVHAGECFGLLGPNGAGKTTTIEILEGLQEPTSGTVEILGHSWGNNAPELRELIGVSLQETQLSEKQTVREILELFAGFYRYARPLERVMEQMALRESADVRVGKLSGGQKQRLAIATALVGNPKILFLDEPTSGLDPQSRRQLWEVIRDFQELGGTVLLTTHYMDEAERLCDRIAIVDRGRVIASGSPYELIERLGGSHVIEFSVDAGIALHAWQSLPGVEGVREDAGTVVLNVREPHRTIPALLALVELRGATLQYFATRHASLEDVFVKLTGRHLRAG